MSAAFLVPSIVFSCPGVGATIRPYRLSQNGRHVFLAKDVLFALGAVEEETLQGAALGTFLSLRGCQTVPVRIGSVEVGISYRDLLRLIFTFPPSYGRIAKWADYVATKNFAEMALALMKAEEFSLERDPPPPQQQPTSRRGNFSNPESPGSPKDLNGFGVRHVDIKAVVSEDVSQIEALWHPGRIRPQGAGAGPSPGPRRPADGARPRAPRRESPVHSHPTNGTVAPTSPDDSSNNTSSRAPLRRSNSMNSPSRQRRDESDDSTENLLAPLPASWLSHSAPNSPQIEPTSAVVVVVGARPSSTTTTTPTESLVSRGSTPPSGISPSFSDDDHISVPRPKKAVDMIDELSSAILKGGNAVALRRPVMGPVAPEEDDLDMQSVPNTARGEGKGSRPSSSLGDIVTAPATAPMTARRATSRPTSASASITSKTPSSSVPSTPSSGRRPQTNKTPQAPSMKKSSPPSNVDDKEVQKIQAAIDYLVQNNRVSSAHAEMFRGALGGDATIHELNFQGDKLKGEGARALAKMLSLDIGSITSVDLTRNDIDDKACVALANMLPLNSTLQKLTLRYNRIGLEGCRAFAAAIPKNRTLRELYLGHNLIGDEGAACIAKAAKSHPAQLKVALDDAKVSSMARGDLDNVYT